MRTMSFFNETSKAANKKSPTVKTMGLHKFH